MREPILIFESIPAGTVRQTIERTVQRTANLHHLLIRFFAGQENTLTVRLYIRKASGAVQELSAYTGNKYFAGDDNDVPINLFYRLEEYDKLCAEVSNSSAYNYDVYVLGEIEYVQAVS